MLKKSHGLSAKFQQCGGPKNENISHEKSQIGLHDIRVSNVNQVCCIRDFLFESMNV